jgi:hypothetical protein
MPVTYKKIASVTVGSGGAASMSFTSIPATYTDLVFHISTRLDSASTANFHLLKFNTSSTNFTARSLQGSGSAASSGSVTQGRGGLDQGTSYTANTFSSTQIYIPNYAGSTNKSYSVETVTENNATEAFSQLLAGLWSDTSAINAIEIYPDTSGRNYVQHTTATLYGISKS